MLSREIENKIDNLIKKGKLSEHEQNVLVYWLYQEYLDEMKS